MLFMRAQREKENERMREERASVHARASENKNNVVSCSSGGGGGGGGEGGINERKDGQRKERKGEESWM